MAIKSDEGIYAHRSGRGGFAAPGTVQVSHASGRPEATPGTPAPIIEHMNEPEPSRLAKLRAVEQYLAWDLAQIRKRIADEEARLAAAPEGWHIQHLPGGDGKRGRGMLHEDGCGFSGRVDLELDRRAAVMALGDDVIETCSGCRPEEGLRG